MEIGVVTDEVARDLAEALEVSAVWGLARFELREGADGRFPFFTRDEIRLLEAALRRGKRHQNLSPHRTWMVTTVLNLKSYLKIIDGVLCNPPV